MSKDSVSSTTRRRSFWRRASPSFTTSPSFSAPGGACFFPSVILATMQRRPAASAPIYAETLPPPGVAFLEATSSLTNARLWPVSAGGLGAGRFLSKVDIVGYQYLSGSNGRCTCSGMNLLWTKVRFLRRVFADLVLEAFKLSFPDVSEVPSFRSRGRFLVEENGHVKFLGELLPESTG